jgi:ADP-heptose:LPS heptosyltransferase
METKDFEGHAVYHLGLRAFPQRQITLETLERSKVPVKVSGKELGDTPVFTVPAFEPKNRLLLHGMAVYPHTKSTPAFWKFLNLILDDLAVFDEVVWVGSARDREVGRRTYPNWAEFDDQGDFLNLAGLMSSSKMVIGVGSSVVALAGALKVPCIRVHDPIGDNPKHIWSNLGDTQINDTEIELRKTWPAFRDRYARAEVVV